MNKTIRWTQVVAAALVAIGTTSAYATDCTPKTPEYCTPQQLEQLRQRQAQAQQQLADARAELSAALTNLNQVTANPNSTSEARAAAQARVDNANRNLNVAQGGAAAATITAAISGGDNAASANGAAGNTTTTTTTTNTKVVNADPVTAYLQSLPVHPQATADTDYICEFRGRPHKVDRNVFFNGTRTEGPVKSGLDAYIWQYATKVGADGKLLVNEYGDPKKFPYSRYLLPFGDHKLPDNFAFEGEMKERMTQGGYWVEVGTIVKYTYLTSGAAYNGSWAAAFGSESRQGSVAAGSGGNIQDRVVVEVKDLNKSCVLNRGELDLIKGLLIPPPVEVCANIPGAKIIPEGMVKQPDGKCVVPPSKSAPAPAAEPTLDKKAADFVTSKRVFTGPQDPDPRWETHCLVTQPNGRNVWVEKKHPKQTCGSRLVTAPALTPDTGLVNKPAAK